MAKLYVCTACKAEIVARDGVTPKQCLFCSNKGFIEVVEGEKMEGSYDLKTGDRTIKVDGKVIYERKGNKVRGEKKEFFT
ncbi:MAG: hypothetical protein ACFE9L_18890 [Candidatus Hodarchaeota archaeon]